MIHLRSAALLVLMFVLPWVLHAQAISMGGAYSDVPRLEFGASYNYFHANAPPGQCGCFALNGGSGAHECPGAYGGDRRGASGGAEAAQSDGSGTHVAISPGNQETSIHRGRN